MRARTEFVSFLLTVFVMYAVATLDKHKIMPDIYKDQDKHKIMPETKFFSEYEPYFGIKVGDNISLRRHTFFVKVVDQCFLQPIKVKQYEP